VSSVPGLTLVTRIDFYSNAESKLQVACQLVARAVREQFQVVVYAPDQETARGIDKLLWTYQAIGFVPHCLASDALASETPVVIAQDGAELAHYHVLVNLHADSPPTFSRFERLIEIVGSDDVDRQRARGRFRYYRDRGYEIHHHDLSKSTP
jgi:DNA polymerase III subunit chi